MLKIVFLILVVTIMFSSTAAMAQSDTALMHPEDAVAGISNKFVRGVANSATGFIEFPKQIYKTFRDDGFFKSIFVGPLKGVGMTLVRTVGGVIDVSTCIVPYPGSYEPYFEPEYAWQGWSE